MPNLYERVIAIPDQAPAQLSGSLPAGSVAGPPLWGDASWVTSELALHAAALAGVDGDLQGLALRAAGVIARIEG